MISVGSVCMVERRPTNNNLFILNKNKLIFAYAYLNDEHFLANKPGRHSTFLVVYLQIRATESCC